MRCPSFLHSFISCLITTTIYLPLSIRGEPLFNLHLISFHRHTIQSIDMYGLARRSPHPPPVPASRILQFPAIQPQGAILIRHHLATCRNLRPARGWTPLSFIERGSWALKSAFLIPQGRSVPFVAPGTRESGICIEAAARTRASKDLTSFTSYRMRECARV